MTKQASWREFMGKPALSSPLANGVVITLDSVSAARESEKIWHLPSHLKDAHPNRRRDWFGGRLALLQAFAHFGVSLDPENTRFTDPQTIHEHPEFRFSISHTDDQVGCWLIKDPAHETRIGFDLERRERTLSPELSKRMRSPSDDSALTDIETWSIKEAIFKALPTVLQDGLVFSKIRLGSSRFEIAGLSVGGHYLLVSDPYLASFAWLSVAQKLHL